MSIPGLTISNLLAHGIIFAEGYSTADVVEQDNNRGDQVDFFNKFALAPAGSSWCCSFVETCLGKAYLQLCNIALTRDMLIAHRDEFAQFFHLTASCEDLRQWAIRQGHYHRKEEGSPQCPCLVFFDFKAEGVAHHIGFVRSVALPYLATTEGNTPSQNVAKGQPKVNEADGDGCHNRLRGLSTVLGYLY